MYCIPTSVSISDLSLSSEIDQAEEKGDFTCLNYMLDNLTRLPVRNDRHVLTTEQDLVRERYESYVRYIMSGGTCETDLGFEEEKEVDDLLGHLTGKSGFPGIALMDQIWADQAAIIRHSPCSYRREQISSQQGQFKAQETAEVERGCGRRD